jgi:hypothetical protein
VLSYYNIINKTIAREQTVCLPSKGTSIFQIVDYLNNYYIKNNISENNYIIIRSKLYFGLNSIYNFINNYSSTNYAIIFKMYRDLYNPNTNKYSQIGHTVSISFFNKEIYYVDPQNNILTKITDKSTLFEYLFKYGFTYIDIIYSVSKYISPNKPYLNKYQAIDFVNNNSNDLHLIPRDDLTGGKIKRKTKKQKGKKKITKKLKPKP